MAVTGFWPVFKNLKATLDYADNPDKTTAPGYLDEDLYAALRYAENDDKTDRKMFVGGSGCVEKWWATTAFRAFVRARSRRSRRSPLARRQHGGCGATDIRCSSPSPEHRQCALSFCCESRVLQGRREVQKQNR